MRECKVCESTGYIITRRGLVLSPQSVIGQKRKRIKISKNTYGYSTIRAKKKTWMLSRLVLQMYCKTDYDYKNEFEADHINEDVNNNSIMNLRWLSQEDNKFKKTVHWHDEERIIKGDPIDRANEMMAEELVMNSLSHDVTGILGNPPKALIPYLKNTILAREIIEYYSSITRVTYYKYLISKNMEFK